MKKRNIFIKITVQDWPVTAVEAHIVDLKIQS